ncbi:MAG: hypothetical protein GY760_03990 [Deltaproteobacteria bacterium]|nr:hypothetical protein [Deltaproteobacteria bacterium]
MWDRKSSEEKVSGVSHRISLLLQMKAALKIKRFKKVGFFFNPREKNSDIIWKKLQNISKVMNFDIVIFPCPPGTNRVMKFLKQIVNKNVVVDMVYLPLDSFIVSNASLIGKQLRIAKIMSMGAQKEYIDSGALLGITPDYYQLGKAASKILDRHQHGEKLGRIPIQTVQKPKLLINEKTRKLLNIKIPDKLLKGATIIDK